MIFLVYTLGRLQLKEETKKPVFLHVGCARKSKEHTPFAGSNWQELRLDIDSQVDPDLVGTMTDLSAVPDQSVQAVFSSHNIEHLYPHEVPKALSEFKRVLSPYGFVLITCPDLQSVCELVAADKLTEPAYQSGQGPISPIDILYGHRSAMQSGNLFMAHHCGFTSKVLSATLQNSGFSSVVKRRPERFDLWAFGMICDDSDFLVSRSSGFMP